MKNVRRSESPNAVSYVRVSTQDQADRDLSLTAQRDAIRLYARQRDFQLVGEFVERGVSATDDNRPEFMRMVNEVALPTSNVAVILVLHTSRFMRHAMKARLWKEKLKRLGVRVIPIQQETADDPSGRFAEGVFELVDQLESETNGLRTRAAMAENARRGYFNGSQPPFGYRIVKVVGPGGTTKNKLEIHADEAELVRELFRGYISGTGAKSLARSMNQRGLRYRGRMWSRDRVLRTLEDSAVVGQYHWGRVDSKTGQLRPRAEWVHMTVPRIIDDETFALASEARKSRDPGKNPGRTASSPLLLSGLARCARCRQTLQLATATGRSGKTFRYYLCRQTARAGVEACRGRRVPEETLNRAVLHAVAEELFSMKRCEQMLREFVEVDGGIRGKAAEQRRLLERERTDIDKRITQLHEHIETSPGLDELVVERLRDLTARRTEVVQRLGRVSPAAPIPPYLYRPATIARFRTRLTAAFVSGEPGTARAYLRRLVAEVTVGEDEIVVEGRTDAMLTMMGGTPASDTYASDEPCADVHAHVVGWRARRDSNP